MNHILRREIEVAFSRHAQPMWFRIVKWIVLIGGAYALWNTEYLWYFIACSVAGGVIVHLLWRYKTKGWTRSWIGWDHSKNTPTISRES